MEPRIPLGDCRGDLGQTRVALMQDLIDAGAISVDSFAVAPGFAMTGQQAWLSWRISKHRDKTSTPEQSQYLGAVYFAIEGHQRRRLAHAFGR